MHSINKNTKQMCTLLPGYEMGIISREAFKKYIYDEMRLNEIKIRKKLFLGMSSLGISDCSRNIYSMTIEEKYYRNIAAIIGKKELMIFNTDKRSPPKLIDMINSLPLNVQFFPKDNRIISVVGRTLDVINIPYNSILTSYYFDEVNADRGECPAIHRISHIRNDRLTIVPGITEIIGFDMRSSTPSVFIKNVHRQTRAPLDFAFHPNIEDVFVVPDNNNFCMFDIRNFRRPIGVYDTNQSTRLHRMFYNSEGTNLYVVHYTTNDEEIDEFFTEITCYTAFDLKPSWSLKFSNGPLKRNLPFYDLTYDSNSKSVYLLNPLLYRVDIEEPSHTLVANSGTYQSACWNPIAGELYLGSYSGRIIAAKAKIPNAEID